MMISILWGNLPTLYKGATMIIMEMKENPYLIQKISQLLRKKTRNRKISQKETLMIIENTFKSNEII